MNNIRELISYYIKFINYDTLNEIDSIIQEYDSSNNHIKKDEIAKNLMIRRNEFINPHIKAIISILEKPKIMKKDLELIITLIKKIINVIGDKKSFIYNSTINNKKITSSKVIKEIDDLRNDFLNESDNLLLNLKNYNKKTKKSTKTKKNDDDINKIKKDYMKYLKELEKFISFIEKNKDKILNYIENEEILISNKEKDKKEIKKEKTRILKVINKYKNKMEKIINKSLDTKKILNIIIKNLYKIKELLLDYPILGFFSYIKNDNIKHKNTYYDKVNKELYKKRQDILKKLYNLTDNIQK